MTISKKWIVACGRCGCVYHHSAITDRCPVCKSIVREKIEGLTEF